MQIHLKRKTQAAKEAGVSRPTIDKWIRLGLIHHYLPPQGPKARYTPRGWVNPIEINNLKSE